MGLAIFGFKKRPVIDAQNTGRDVYEKPYGDIILSSSGFGGANNFRSLSPISSTSFNRPVVTRAALAGQGSANGISTNPDLIPLNDKLEKTQF